MAEIQGTQSTPEKGSLHNFTINDFKRSIDSMIATHADSYNRSVYNGASQNRGRRLPESQIADIIERGTPRAQQELSNNYFIMDGTYRRIIIYYATFLTYRGLLIPNTLGSHKVSEPSIAKKYQRALDFLDNIHLPTLCTDFMTKALINGTYYGVIQTLDKDHFTILDLPSAYCYSRYKDLKNNDIIEFDLGYFDSIMDETMRNNALAVYPAEIANAYATYQQTKTNRYYRIPSEIGICFPLFDGRPFFLPIIPQINSYREYEEFDKEKDKEELKKILVQEIPHLNDGTLLFEPVEVEEIHRGTVGMLKGNKNIDVLTTYGKVNVQGTNTTSETATKNNLDKVSQTIYRNAGVSSQVFAATGNMALNVSLENDLALVMSIVEKFNRFFSNIINRLFGNNAVRFKYMILPISYYNTKEYIDNAYKEATAGYSFFLPALAMGLSQKDIVSIKQVENELLDLTNVFVPLKTSYTETGEGGDTGGRPQTDDDKKSDKTIKNIESGAEE